MSRAKQKQPGASAEAPASQNKAEVKITAAKGRPMLTWVGKRPLSHVTSFPAQHVESYPAPGFGGSASLDPPYADWPAQQTPLLKPKIDDWRAMVDCVMIDPAYDGQVFRVALADLPAKKTDLVQGTYELPAPKGKATVAVKIVDMLREEVLVVAEE